MFANTIRRAAAQSAVFHIRRAYTNKATSTTKERLTEAIKPKVNEAKEKAKEKAAPKVGKLKELAQKYGAAGVIVYLGIGMVDLGLTFAGIQVLGQDKVKQLEDTVINKVNEWRGKPPRPERDPQEQGQASLASVFVLAYGIHKTLFLPFRVTVTAAITPAVVRKIHALGWAKYAPRLFPAVKTEATAAATVAKNIKP
ncbi:hypothetical protein BDA99DRAFT_522537 [Phascolomyces articulosus]|uniref:DUF1279 domain-containing protein n=1 Tax=Phascolomyces articulosus TaxID=60185 RepID=A0AAD5P9U4_9FUNG|nr:hypothetical protein BDA99DRAFT_522537 [Phascolomyces articulosus]